MRASNYANIDRSQKEGTVDKEKDSAHSHRVQQLNESLRSDRNGHLAKFAAKRR